MTPEIMDSLNRAKYMTIDTETVSLTDRTCIGIGVQWSDTESAYFQVLPYTDPDVLWLMDILGDPKRTKIYFNAMFDLRVLYDLAYDEGYTLPDMTNIEDASMAAQIQGQPDHSLDGLTTKLLGYTNPLSIKGLLTEAGRGSTTLDIPLEGISQKCLNDVKATWILWDKVKRAFPNLANEKCYFVDMKLIPVLFKMGNKGLGLRPNLLQEHHTALTAEIEECVAICADYGFHPGKNAEVGYVLATRGNILPFTKKGKQLRTDEEALEAVDDPLVATILKYRHASKLLSTYVTPWIGEERAYSNFRIDLSTGRLASFDRNLQNIPPAMRAVFRPDNRVFTWMDYSQIELRVLANISKDVTMMEAYKTGTDLHQMTASAAGVSRSQGKTGNFAMVFGASDKVIAKNAGMGLDKVKDLRNAFKSLYPGAMQYMARQTRTRDSYVESMFGRRMGLPLYNPEINQNPRAFDAHISKCAINWPIQATAADIIKRAMLTLEDADLRVQVHDELVVDGAYEFSEELAHMHPDFITPFEVKSDYSWL